MKRINTRPSRPCARVRYINTHLVPWTLFLLTRVSLFFPRRCRECVFEAEHIKVKAARAAMGAAQVEGGGDGGESKAGREVEPKRPCNVSRGQGGKAEGGAGEMSGVLMGVLVPLQGLWSTCTRC